MNKEQLVREFIGYFGGTAEGIRVFAVHPGRLRTSVAAADADTEPADAARELADWVERVDREAPVGCHDLMRGGLIEW